MCQRDATPAPGIDETSLDACSTCWRSASVYIDEDDQLRVENNRPFEMLLDPDISANALTWCPHLGRERHQSPSPSQRFVLQGFEPCEWDGWVW